MTARFGDTEWVKLWSVKGGLSAIELYRLGADIAQAIDMDVVSQTLDLFPSPRNGKGGVGLQIYWAWTESFLVISTWPELGIFRVYLASCKEISEKGEIQLHKLLSAFGLVQEFPTVVMSDVNLDTNVGKESPKEVYQT